MRFEFEVDGLSYGYIEEEICRILDLGYAVSSGFPLRFNEGDSGNYSISGTERDAKVHIKVSRSKTGKYVISCTGESKRRR